MVAKNSENTPNNLDLAALAAQAEANAANNQNPNAPELDKASLRESAGIGTRIWEGIKGAAVSGTGTAILGTFGGMVAGGVGGYLAGEALESVMPSGQDVKDGINAGINNANGQAMPADLSSTAQAVADRVSFRLESAADNSQVEQLSKTYTDAATQYDAIKDNMSGMMAKGGALAGGVVGGTSGAIGGGAYGAAKGALWTDKIKREREARKIGEAVLSA